MPTVLRVQGFKILIYFDDHDPAHVPVLSGEGSVKIALGDRTVKPSILEYQGKRNNATRALQIVNSNQEKSINYWEDIHGTTN